MDSETIRCTTCKNHKSREEFHNNSHNSSGKSSRCKPCAIAMSKKWRQENPERSRERIREWQKNNVDRRRESSRRWYDENRDRARSNKLKWYYGISLVEFNSMFSRQGGKCAICQKETVLVVDHNHDTNIIRELLCKRCNTAIGLMDEDCDIIGRAIMYIQKHSNTKTTLLVEAE